MEVYIKYIFSIYVFLENILLRNLLRNICLYCDVNKEYLSNSGKFEMIII